MIGRYWIFVFLVTLASSAIAIDFSALNTQYWYDTKRGIDIQYRVVKKDPSNTVFIRMRDVVSARGKFRFYLQDDYSSEQHIELSDLVFDTLRQTGNNILFSLNIDPGSMSLLVIHYQYAERNVDFYYPINLKRGKLDAASFYPVDTTGLPVMTSFVKSEIVFEVPSDSVFCFQYQEQFNPADPPMGTVQTVSPSLVVDSVLRAVDGSGLMPGYFYFVQRDTLSTEGITLYTATPHFPNYRRLEDLVMPLTYFSRSSELKKILNSRNPKKEFDQFWLTTYGSQESARSAIRSYYRKVSQANALFTDYKPGWKTDRGIIYIMFGEPVEVYRDDRSEIWKYPDAEFEFRIISNLFAPQLYVLLRDKDYEDAWNTRVRMIRGGQ